MRKFVSLPVEQLVSDVAVDAVHVRELADSIKVSGPISPVLVREGTSELIDGFHRVAAMKELGFSSVECIVTACDEESFWDLRIMSATLHKAVTFARAVDWIGQVFKMSPLGSRYKSAFSLFNDVHHAAAPQEVREWAETKAAKWGLKVGTIREWLYAKNAMAPDLFEEVKGEPRLTVTPSAYIETATSLPRDPDLQRRLIEKVEREGLTREGIREVARALRQAADEEEVKTVLSQPVTRTAEEMTRAAKVEKLLREPTVEPTRAERQHQLAGLALEVYLDLQQQVHNVRRLRPEILETLTAAQRGELLQVVDELMVELQRVGDSLRGVLETRAIEGGHT